MFVIAPLIILGALTVVFASRPAASKDWLRAVVCGAVAVGLWAVLGAELLGSVRALGPTGVRVWWTAPAACLAVVAVARCRRCPPLSMKLRGPELAMALACLGLLILTGLIALLTPPTTHDCLSYHLPRQLFWIQQHSVEHFPARDLRCLEMPPLAEFIGAQLMLLSGTDHQANMVQWCAFALSGAAAAATAKEFGAGARGQWLSALLVLCNPMAAIQSLNPKNDVVCAFFGIVVMYACARLLRHNARSWPDRLLLASALGLMILTKGTAFLIAGPPAAVVGIRMLAVLRVRAVLPGLVMTIVVLGINAGHWRRNFESFGSPLALPASRGGFKLTNDDMSPGAMLSNLVRNVSLHTGTPWAGVNQAEQHAAEWLHGQLGWSITDPRTTYLPAIGFAVVNRWNHDSGASAPVHLALIIACAGALAIRRYRPGKDVVLLFGGGLAASVLFCVLFKWQPWHGRLHVPFFAVLTPHLAIWLMSWRWELPRRSLVAGAACLAAAAVVYNDTKPLVGERSILRRSRDEVFFTQYPTWRTSAICVANEVAAKKPRVVGLALDTHTCEYWLMRLILDRASPPPRFLTMFTTTNPYPSPDEPEPDVVCITSVSPPLPQVHSPTGTYYEVQTLRGVYSTLYPTLRAADLTLNRDVDPFHGWELVGGLGAVQGPFPQWDLPLVRWGQVPETRLRFTAQAEPMVLVLQCRRNERADLKMTIKLNGEVIREQEFGAAWVWVPILTRMSPRPGPNELTIEYANADGPKPGRSVLFRRLQIVPESWLATDHPPP